MKTLCLFRVRRLPLGTLLGAVAALAFTGCQTPDLKPFATATDAVATGIRQGGELAIGPILQTPMIVGQEVVGPDSPKHPGHKLKTEWDARKAAADALQVYSSSLTALDSAAEKRKDNAQGVVDAVTKLAKAIPGVSVGSDAAGKLVANALATFIEVKSFHDMSEAVTAADPVIRSIASALVDDFSSLADTYETVQLAKLPKLAVEIAPPAAFEAAIVKQRDAQRVLVAGAPSDKDKAVELARLDAVLASVGPELTAKRAEIQRIQASIATGRQFFDTAARSVTTWAQAHAEIARALREHRTPSLAVLVARAQELHTLVEAMQKAK